MSKKKSARPNALEHIQDIASDVAKEKKRDEKPKKAPRKQDRTRATYDLPPGMIAEITALSDEWKASRSAIAELFLRVALDAYKAGGIDIEPRLFRTASLKYLYDIDSGYDTESN
jgi:hypothetical protein